ncbi:long-chain acyl-CoA synthetase [Rhodobacteraceae bacterium MBR-64]|jgi:long-chain acyl-CoA synthetase
MGQGFGKGGDDLSRAFKDTDKVAKGASAMITSAQQGCGDRFSRHVRARVFDATGLVGLRPVPSETGVIDDTLGPAALACALDRAADGRAFRIGAGDHADCDLPQAGAVPMFETLTSGSTGASRRIRRSQASWVRSFDVNAGLFGIGPGTGVAVLGRLVHSLALYGAIEALHLGADLHLLDRLRPDRQVAAIAARGVAVLYATPAQLRLMIEAGRATAPGLRHVLVGGSKLDPVTRAGLAALFPGARVREFYGAAETSFIALAGPDTPDAAVGRAYPGVAIQVRDRCGRAVPDGETGEIWVQSPYLFDGYAGDAPGASVWRDGWLSVGEFGRIEAGNLFLAGRGNRMVTIADHNVFPEEIEALLLTLPGVVRAAVIPRPDGLRGHVLHAVISGSADPAEVRAACRAAMGPLKAPRRVHLRAEWPVLASGKTDLRAIAQGLE